MQLRTSLVQLQVASGRVELLVLDDVRLCIAKVAEDGVVEEDASLVDSFFLLALAAHAENWLESSKLLHFAELVIGCV